jgi:hypothetical protein
MATSDHENFSLTHNYSVGGAVRVTCTGTTGQGNGGTALGCSCCWLTTPSTNTGPVRVNIGAAASAVLGVEIPKATVQMYIPIDDISKLYFYSATTTDVIDILWLG